MTVLNGIFTTEVQSLYCISLSIYINIYVCLLMQFNKPLCDLFTLPPPHLLSRLSSISFLLWEGKGNIKQTRLRFQISDDDRVLQPPSPPSPSASKISNYQTNFLLRTGLYSCIWHKPSCLPTCCSTETEISLACCVVSSPFANTCPTLTVNKMDFEQPVPFIWSLFRYLIVMNFACKWMFFNSWWLFCVHLHRDCRWKLNLA